MKALRYHGRHDIRIDEVEVPNVCRDSVKVKVEWCGVCGSDLHEYEEGPIMVPEKLPNAITGEMTPIVMGHEFCGNIVEVGEGVDGVRVGDRVAVEPLMYCHECLDCRRGDYHLCQRLAIIGIHGMAGGFAEYAVVPGYSVHRIPDSLSIELGALVEPLSVGWHAMRTSRFRAGESALVIGAGPVGLSTLLCLQAAGALWIAVSVRREGQRKETATRLHADAVINSSSTDVGEEIQEVTRGRGVDVVFETSGTQAGMDSALAAVRPGGTIVTVAAWAGQGYCDYMRVLMKEVKLIGSMCYANDFPGVINALARERIRGAELMITKRVPLIDSVRGSFETLIAEKANHVKIIVKP